ncbi:hypothetical protein K1728_06560 [Weissella confusa]|uniref:hypothetical protein n=1 Tax=Weissella confusa TaxID=1583 RepID=UPI001C6FA0A5|nr:hypothetical protein [Weissella confusa]QYU56853.1 hypothetical protein K1728_06560 [Weissella confusa]
MATKQTEANKRWQAKNREKSRYLQGRSRARAFIQKQANAEDLVELQQLIKQAQEGQREESGHGKSQ